METETGEPRSLDYRSRPVLREEHARHQSALFKTLVNCGLAVLLAAMFIPLPSIGRHVPGSAMSVACMSNLHQIGLAVRAYADRHVGIYPDGFAALLTDGSVLPRTLICPATADTAATGPMSRAGIANLTTDHHASYVYVGSGLTTQTITPTSVVAYEPVGNHRGRSDVLWGDGHVSPVPTTLLPTLLRSGTTRPATAPTRP